jgi:hypothetical protein
MTLSTRRSKTFEQVHRREMGLKEAGSWAGLPGLRRGIMFASFHILGIALWMIE